MKWFQAIFKPLTFNFFSEIFFFLALQRTCEKASLWKSQVPFAGQKETALIRLRPFEANIVCRAKLVILKCNLWLASEEKMKLKLSSILNCYWKVSYSFASHNFTSISNFVFTNDGFTYHVFHKVVNLAQCLSVEDATFIPNHNTVTRLWGCSDTPNVAITWQKDAAIHSWNCDDICQPFMWLVSVLSP